MKKLFSLNDITKMSKSFNQVGWTLEFPQPLPQKDSDNLLTKIKSLITNDDVEIIRICDVRKDESGNKYFWTKKFLSYSREAMNSYCDNIK